MEADLLANSVMVGVALLFLASVSALVLQRLHFPYTVGLVILGVGLAAAGAGVPGLEPTMQSLEFTPGFVMFIFVPVLIFESAFNTSVHRLIRNLVPALGLAIPGLMLSAAVIGYGAHTLAGLPLGTALVLGTILSATDPVAVIALFKEIGAPKRLTILIEGESLLNDATAIVAYQIVLAVVITGVFDATTVATGAWQFLTVFVGGLVIGLGFGYLLVMSIRSIGDEPLVQIALTGVVAYGSFVVSEHLLHTSGVMAVLGAGLVIGYYGEALYSRQVRDHLQVFWENIAFIANSFIFLLLGLSVLTFLSNLIANPSRLLVPCLVVIGLALATRAAVIGGVIGVTNRLPGQRPISGKYQFVMFWGGLRGAIAVVLALSLPATFPFRWQIIDITFAVILFTLLLNGTTMTRLLRRLGLDRPPAVLQYLGAFDEVASKHATLARLDADAAEAVDGSAEAEAAVRAQLTAELAAAERHLSAARAEMGTGPDVERQLTWMRALALAGQVYRERFDHGLLHLRGRRELEWDLREQERAILAGAERPEAILPDRLTQRLARAGWWARFDLALRGQRGAGEVQQLAAILDAAQLILASLDEIERFCGTGDGLGALSDYYTAASSEASRALRRIGSETGQDGRPLEELHLFWLAREQEQDNRRRSAIGLDTYPTEMVERFDGTR